MLDTVVRYCAMQPRRLRGLGYGLFAVGASLLLLGAAGRLATRAAIDSRAYPLLLPEDYPGLAQLLPAWPTSLVPETGLGVAVALLIMFSGMVLCEFGQRLHPRR